MYYSYVMGIDNSIEELKKDGFIDDEVLALCESLCKCKFESIKAMLLGNHLYKDKIN